MPSTCSCVLSRVMQTWLGTSSGISFSECLYATLSTKGTRKFRPGVRVAWYLPRRSSTQAFCCGTTLSVRTTKMPATMSRMKAISIGKLRSCDRSDFFHHQPAAADLAHAVRAGAMRNPAEGHHRPIGAPVAHLRRVVRRPGIHLDGL